jgi:hypothetical protein
MLKKGDRVLVRVYVPKKDSIYGESKLLRGELVKVKISYARESVWKDVPRKFFGTKQERVEGKKVRRYKYIVQLDNGDYVEETNVEKL